MRKLEFNFSSLSTRITSSIPPFFKNKIEYIFFFFFAILAFLTVHQYGITVDEPQQRYMGFVCGDYIFKNIPYYLTFPDNDHGVVIELPLVIIERFFNITNTRTIFLMRHLVCHLFFILSAVYFFKLIVLLYNNKQLAILGFLFLVVNPVIYGHSFFNSKDLPFLSLYIICMYQFACAFKTKKTHQFLLLGLFSGLLIGIRIMGILFVPTALLFLGMDAILYRKNNYEFRLHLKNTFIYISSVLISTIVFWPILWHHPIANFLRVFQKMSKFSYESIVNYRGEFVLTANMPWHYIPTWFIISNPIAYLILGFCGVSVFLFTLIKNPFKQLANPLEKNALLHLILFIAPIIAIIILHSVVFDSWRHLFAIYPPFILLAIYFINKAIGTKFKKTVNTISIASISLVAIFMISNFPFQHVYFNQLVSLHKNEYIRKNYEMDFWGASSKKALDYILENDTAKIIHFYSTNSAAHANLNLLFDHQKKRLQYVYSLREADYFITDYRWHPSDYKSPGLTEIKSFRVLNNQICTIFKVQKK